MTYTVIARNRNSWTQAKDGSCRVYDIAESCGHKHRTIVGAVQCFRAAKNTTLGLGWVENNAIGEGISNEQHYAACQELHEQGL